jgi:hypothetical protein
VSIGSGKFEQSDFNLTYPAKDASDLVQCFTKNSSLYEGVKVYSLLDREVTREAVLALHAKLMTTRPEDRVILFFAGHGSLEKKGEDYQLLLSTYDIDFSNPSQRGVRYEELEGILDGIPAREKVMLLDGCHTDEVDSKGVAQAKNKSIKTGNKKFRTGSETDLMSSDALFYEMKELYVDVRRGSGATILAGTRGQGQAQESEAWNNGAYTKVLLEGLSSRADLNSDGKIFCSELQTYLGEEVPKLTGGEQVPATRRENIYNDILLWQYAK